MRSRSERRIQPRDLEVDDSDAALIAACRGGDAVAWNKLVGRYERLVFAVASYEGLGPDDAADVTQLTFEALLDQVDDLLNADRLRWWLTSVARRTSWKTRERVRRDAPLEITESWQRRLSVPDGADDRAELQSLVRALDQLGEPCRELLTQLYFDPSEPSYAEIAANLGRSQNGIGPSRSRCLAHLRQILESISVDG